MMLIKEELHPPHKHFPRLVLFYVPSSIPKLYKIIQFPYGFGCGKDEIEIAIIAGNMNECAPWQWNVL